MINMRKEQFYELTIPMKSKEEADTKCKAFNDNTRDADYVPFSNWAWVQCRGNVWCLNIRIPYIVDEPDYPLYDDNQIGIGD